MVYKNILKATFKNRPNRFIAECIIDNQEAIVHVKNTGRCRELLVPDVEVYLEYFPESSRKTKYDLITVNKNGRLINMDSAAPNKVIYEALNLGKNILNNSEPLTYIKMEQKYNQSRFDVYAETSSSKIFAEIKGVTLEENNIVMFPDAPTERGVKHIMELIDAKDNGFDAHIIFVIQMENPAYFTPNYKTHKEFGQALKLAKDKGVNISAWDCLITENSITLNKQVNIIL
ncbi:MAG: DNA/RNA nuclease SfsA [Candidatus Mucispirillum faecigallinarum]|nr:DNA/RNA nuclease SfsA [Candidatus Mucispirillum faecigallinarum]